LLEHRTSRRQYFMVVLEGWEDEEDQDAGRTTSKISQGYQQEQSVSRERVKDISGGNWCGRRPLSPTFSNEVGLKKKKKKKCVIIVIVIKIIIIV